MKAACPRQWQVEAARDGRLSSDDIDHFEVHRARCLSCRQETLEIESVAELVRRNDHPRLDDLSLRRLRQRLLANADTAIRSPPTHVIGSSKLVLAVALPAIFAGSLVLRPRAEARSATTVAAQSATTVIVPPGTSAARSDKFRTDEPAVDRVPEPADVFGHSTPRGDIPNSAPSHLTPPARSRRAKSTHGVPLASVADSALGPSRAAAEIGIAEEDLAYLQILALLNEGRKEEALLAARSYVARFPDGFRGPEVRTIARGR